MIELYKKYREIINYLIVGVLTTIVSIGSYNIFRLWIEDTPYKILGLSFDGYIICTILSWIVAVAFAYFANRRFVFESKEKNIFKEMSQFFGARLLSLGSEIVVMMVLVDLLSINDRISKIIVQFIILVLNYLFSKLLVFKKKKV